MKRTISNDLTDKLKAKKLKDARRQIVLDLLGDLSLEEAILLLIEHSAFPDERPGGIGLNFDKIKLTVKANKRLRLGLSGTSFADIEAELDKLKKDKEDAEKKDKE